MHRDVELAGGAQNALPGRIALGIGDLCDLHESRDCISDMGGVLQRLLSISLEGKNSAFEVMSRPGAELVHG